jgi:hypothetical protein
MIAVFVLAGAGLATRAVAGAPAPQAAGGPRAAKAAPAVTTSPVAPSPPAAAPAAAPAPPPPSPAPVPRVDAAGTVWLCRPGLPDNPCAQSLDTTSVTATGTRQVRRAAPAAGSAFDCFYVYPTVSTQGTPNADLSVDPAETEVATRQAALFSQVCNVWAPIYRQPTMAAFSPGSSSMGAGPVDVAYASLLSGWKDYLAHYNDGRPVILIGHSTGTTMLISLLQQQFDSNPALRRQLVSALLIGGYPDVAPGSNVGGSFRTIPACRAAGQTGCVIGFNAYYGPPPAGSQFGRAGALCTNPAALGGGSGSLDPYLVAASNSPGGGPVATPYVEYPGLYTATCQSAGGMTWLDVTPVKTPGDPRPLLTERLGPSWGLHADEVSLTLGNLLADITAEEAAYG